tara:strand:- start:7177 stop:7377 length:201 start_codon:yes stop_codon:yes gene_type:complete
MCEQQNALECFAPARIFDVEPALRDVDVELLLLVTARVNSLKPKGGKAISNYNKGHPQISQECSSA